MRRDLIGRFFGSAGEAADKREIRMAPLSACLIADLVLMDENLRNELNGLLDTIDRLQRIAVTESQALNLSEMEMTDASLARLRDAHLAELDVIHSLVARVALLRRRHPDLG